MPRIIRRSQNLSRNTIPNNPPTPRLPTVPPIQSLGFTPELLRGRRAPFLLRARRRWPCASPTPQWLPPPASAGPAWCVAHPTRLGCERLAQMKWKNCSKGIALLQLPMAWEAQAEGPHPTGERSRSRRQRRRAWGVRAGWIGRSGCSRHGTACSNHLVQVQCLQADFDSNEG